MQLTLKKVRLILSLSLLIEARSFAPKVIKLSGILLKPLPEMMKSVHAWTPAALGMATTHALSGATTAVKSAQGNSINVQAGENLSYQFYTSRYTAGSYELTGLPSGLTYDGSNAITGTISQVGSYTVKITGYRGANKRGAATPTFSLDITVEEADSTSESSGDLRDYFGEISDLGNQWYQTWLGIIYISNNGNWVFHSDLGWMYAQSIAQDSFWFYDEEVGWLYRSKTLGRFCYRHSTGGWLYQLNSTSANRFWDFNLNTEIR